MLMLLDLDCLVFRVRLLFFSSPFLDQFRFRNVIEQEKGAKILDTVCLGHTVCLGQEEKIDASIFLVKWSFKAAPLTTINWLIHLYPNKFNYYLSPEIFHMDWNAYLYA